MDESSIALAAPVAAPPLTRARAVASSVFGLAALGLAAGLGSGSLEVALRAIPASVAAPLGGFVLTGPALIVAHQYLQLQAEPQRIVDALAEGFSNAGVVALGLTPVMLFFSATTNHAGRGFMLAAALALLIGLTGARDALWQAELDDAPAPSLRARWLASGWATLTTLVTLRLAMDLQEFVLEPLIPHMPFLYSTL